MSHVEADHLLPTAAGRSEKTLPAIAWVTLLLGLWPAGLVIACLEGGKSDAATASYYRYLKRTCLVGVPALLVSTLLTIVLIGFPMMIAVSFWYLARCVKALIAVYKGEPVANAETWFV